MRRRAPDAGSNLAARGRHTRLAHVPTTQFEFRAAAASLVLVPKGPKPKASPCLQSLFDALFVSSRASDDLIGSPRLRPWILQSPVSRTRKDDDGWPPRRRGTLLLLSSSSPHQRPNKTPVSLHGVRVGCLDAQRQAARCPSVQRESGPTPAGMASQWDGMHGKGSPICAEGATLRPVLREDWTGSQVHAGKQFPVQVVVMQAR
ncbi:hypothetical protein CSOJ01_02339 [Colletotrichum sojae]|uniref:Uncharacterized protein n=1 Tax=Colletotrichum sojae TaxID=2175907 RepID=A0A8H6JQP5_9PEZI|nr:hypothetical protein CSOJ01_02339 [Colletotrichum sojae]